MIKRILQLIAIPFLFALCSPYIIVLVIADLYCFIVHGNPNTFKKHDEFSDWFNETINKI